MFLSEREKTHAKHEVFLFHKAGTEYWIPNQFGWKGTDPKESKWRGIFKGPLKGCLTRVQHQNFSNNLFYNATPRHSSLSNRLPETNNKQLLENKPKFGPQEEMDEPEPN